MSSLRLGILSDLHRTTDPRERSSFHNEYDFTGHAARVQRALAWFEQQAVDALLLCGDLTHTGDETAMTTVLGECCTALDVPVIVVSGNHDVAHGKDTLARGIQRLADDRIVPGDPSGELVRGIRVAGLQLAPTSGYVRSRLRALPAIEEWGDEPVVLVSHLPLLSRATTVAAQGAQYPGDLVDRERAAVLLRARRVATVVVAGHIHVRDVHHEASVLQLAQAAMIEAPFEAAVVDICADVHGRVAVTRRTHRVADRRAEWEPTLVGPVGSWRFADSSWAVGTEPIDEAIASA